MQEKLRKASKSKRRKLLFIPSINNVIVEIQPLISRVVIKMWTKWLFLWPGALNDLEAVGTCYNSQRCSALFTAGNVHHSWMWAEGVTPPEWTAPSLPSPAGLLICVSLETCWPPPFSTDVWAAVSKRPKSPDIFIFNSFFEVECKRRLFCCSVIKFRLDVLAINLP